MLNDRDRYLQIQYPVNSKKSSKKIFFKNCCDIDSKTYILRIALAEKMKQFQNFEDRERERKRKS